MFGSKKKTGAIEVAKLSSLIADNLHIVGDVHFTGGLRVDGRIEGSVFSKPGGKGLLVLSEKGSISGKVHAYDAVINGTISGDIDVEHFLELQANAKVTGNLRYRQLQMDCGATVDGKLMRVHDEARTLPGDVKALPDATAPAPVAAVPAPRPAQSAAPRPELPGLPPSLDSRPPAAPRPRPDRPADAPATSAAIAKDRVSETR